MPTSQILPNNGSCSNGRSPRSGGGRGHRRRANVRIQLDGRWQDIRAGQLRDPDDLAALEQQLARCASPTFHVGNISILPDDDRFELLSLIAGAHGYRITVGQDEQAFDNLFDAVLHCLDGQGGVQGCENQRRAAVEAAALCHPDALPIACGRIVRRMREVGIGGALPQSLVKEARELLAAQQTAISAEQAACELISQQKLTLLGTGDDAFTEESLVDMPVVAFHGDQFFGYEGTRWRHQPDEDFKARIAAFLQNTGHGNQVTTRFVNDVVMNVKGATLLPQNGFAPPFWIDDSAPAGYSPSPYLAFQNGLLNLQEALNGSPVLYGHNARHFSPVVLPFEFDPDATCPLWHETLIQILRPRRRYPFPARQPNDRRMLVLQEFFGRTLEPRNTSADKCLVPEGPGSNGKSTIAFVLDEMLGLDNVSHVPLDKIGGEFRLAPMIGKHANIAAEMSWIDKVDEGVFKGLVTGDWTEANRKYKDPISMRPTAKLLFGTNSIPPFHDRSRGIWRRLILMPLYARFEGADEDLARAERLKVELPGIFNWALEGAQRFHRQRGYTRCGVCEARLREHRFHSDPLQQFLAECCIRGAGRIAYKDELCDALKQWCDRNGRKHIASTELGKQLLKIRGVTSDREGSGARRYYYLGVGLIRRA
jgi:P4 family phage/plasmid primase-like protien